MKSDTLIFTFFLIATLILCQACESRNFTATRPDGTTITYRRVSIIGDSSSEGVSVSKQGEDLTVDVGATGSQAKIEALGAVVDLLK
jgi:hypothetical protein